MRKDKPLWYILGVITGLLTASLCTACGGITDTDNDNGLGRVSGISSQQYKAEKLHLGNNPPVKGPEKRKPSQAKNPNKKKLDKKKPDKINLKNKTSVTKPNKSQTKQGNTNLKKQISKPTVGIIPPRSNGKNDLVGLINPVASEPFIPYKPKKPVNPRPIRDTPDYREPEKPKHVKPETISEGERKEKHEVKDGENDNSKPTGIDKSGINKQFNDDEEVQQINGQ